MSDDAPHSGLSVRYDLDTNTYQATFDSTNLDPSIAIVQVLASIRETDPASMEPVYETIDPNALDSLIRNRHPSRATGDLVIEFAYLEYSVTVKSYGVIEARPLTENPTVSEER